MSKLATVGALPVSLSLQSLQSLQSLHQQVLDRLTQVEERLSVLPPAARLVSVETSLGTLAPDIAAQVLATLEPLRHSLPSRQELESVLSLQRATLADLASEVGQRSFEAIDQRLAPHRAAHQELVKQARSSSDSLSGLDEAVRRLQATESPRIQ